MVSNNDDIETLAEEIEQIRAEQPHVGSLLKAFGPLFLEKSRWLMEVGDYTEIFPIDAVQYLGGIPLIQQCQLFLPDDPWKSAGLSVAEAIRRGLPHFAGDMAGLTKQIAEEKVDCFTLVNSSTAPDESQLADRAQEFEIEPMALQVFLRFVTQFMLSKRAQDMAAELAPLTWNKGYCPVCGSFPQLAIIKEQGQRWLQCGDCSHEWKFPRLTCPCCDHEDPKDTNYLFVEGKKEDSAFTCSNCRKYLITSNRSGNLQQAHAGLIALSLAHLDLILQDKGFLPMAECEWNSFGASSGV